jgi:beta-lactamase class A
MSAVSISDVKERVRALAEGFDGDWTLALTDLSTGERIGIREDELMPTASVIKVPILISVYRAAAEGGVSLEDRLRSGPENTVIGSGVLNKLSAGVEMSLRDAAVLMSIISDNVATNMCIDHIGGIDYVNDTMRAMGLEKTTMFTRLGDPSRGLKGRDHYVMTARETVALWEMIGGGKAVSEEASRDMLRILKRQQHREKLGRFLPWNELNTLPDPRNNWLATKGGTYIFGVRNDSGIMHGPRGEVAIAVFTEGGTRGSGHNADGNVLIGEIGKLVWETMCA